MTVNAEQTNGFDDKKAYQAQEDGQDFVRISC